MLESLLVPEERIGVLTREVRDRLERETEVKTRIDGNAVLLDGEGIAMLTARNFVRAIGRGFSPERAWRLLQDEQTLDVIELGQLSDSRQKNVRARVIGSGGRMRGRIELKTGAIISVYHKTISIIGDWEQVQKARKAIEMIIKGSEISTVNRYLERGKVK